MRGEVVRSALEGREPSLGVATVPLQRPRRSDEDDGCGREPARAADDVDELLEAKVTGEAAFRDDVVGELQPDEIADERAVAVRDVREGPSVNERRLAFERLHEVGLERVLEENGHRAGDVELLGSHGLPVEGCGDGNRAETVTEVVAVAGHREQGHHLGGGGDVEAGLARERSLLTDPDGYTAQEAVLDVETAAPRDHRRVDTELVAVDEVRIDGGGKKVVGSGDCM